MNWSVKRYATSSSGEAKVLEISKRRECDDYHESKFGETQFPKRFYYMQKSHIRSDMSTNATTLLGILARPKSVNESAHVIPMGIFAVFHMGAWDFEA